MKRFLHGVVFGFIVGIVFVSLLFFLRLMKDANQIYRCNPEVHIHNPLNETEKTVDAVVVGGKIYISGESLSDIFEKNISNDKQYKNIYID